MFGDLLQEFHVICNVEHCGCSFVVPFVCNCTFKDSQVRGKFSKLSKIKVPSEVFYLLQDGGVIIS